MPLGTIDRTPPPLFRQGPSALSKLLVCSALAVFLMVADLRFRVAEPVRAVVATALAPLRAAVLQPVAWAQTAGGYFQSLHEAQQAEARARQELGQQALRANQAELLLLENTRLRALLELRTRTSPRGVAAEVLYDAADPYSRKIVLDKGTRDGVQAGAPVIDEGGVLGQVTRVFGHMSEVTLLTDRDQAIPVLNTRTGVRGVAFGNSDTHSGQLELRFTAANADIAEGDILSTSGVDGVYPPGLQVARVAKVERRADSSFARVALQPFARAGAALHVMVLQPLDARSETGAAPGTAPEDVAASPPPAASAVATTVPARQKVQR